MTPTPGQMTKNQQHEGDALARYDQLVSLLFTLARLHADVVLALTDLCRIIFRAGLLLLAALCATVRLLSPYQAGDAAKPKSTNMTVAMVRMMISSQRVVMLDLGTNSHWSLKSGFPNADGMRSSRKAQLLPPQPAR